ncbi:discoidin domain-containing protein [Fontivita pretiosa]|uniref:discoidin domain-containing protein n=1 Tax=Fontivita pretiosa TaxID=2989684 RepID=UPI003D16E790
MKWLWLIMSASMLASSSGSDAAQPASRSLLDVPSAWKPIASEGVKIQTAAEKTNSGGNALRIDFDFTAGAGYGGVYLDLPIDLPPNYAFTFSVHGHGPANNLELKLIDPEGLNVWWVNRRAFDWPAEPTRLSNRRRHFQFAWGPGGGSKPLSKLGRVELIIAANEGGRGTVWIEDFDYTPLPPEKPYAGTPLVTASSGSLDRASLQKLITPQAPPWIAADDDAHPWLAVDFGEPRDLGGVVVYRPAGHAPANFDVQVSDDGTSWSTVRRVRGASLLPSELMLPDLQARWLRLAFARSDTAPRPAVSRVELLDPSAGSSANTFWMLRAKRAARGLYPRTLLNEQSFWTVVGQIDDPREALINEEGQIEADRRSFSIEPLLVREDGAMLSWADGTHEQSLRDGWAPIATVVRTHRRDGLELTITALAAGEPGASSLHVAYAVRNTSQAPTHGRLVLAIRPVQVLPPWQDLNIAGGWTAIESIRADSAGLVVNDAKRVFAGGGEFRAGAAPYDSGDVVELLAAGHWPGEREARCPQRSASGLLAWDFALPAGEASTYLVCVPFHGIDPPNDRPRDAGQFESLAARVLADWSARVDRATFRLPASARQFHDTIRAMQAYILINHDGKGFQPGSRTYERSWIRDGSMTSAAMLEFGHEQLVRRFVDWYAPFQFESGKVPCVVDRRGADPVPEHDSHGQLLWLIANTHRYTRDDELVRRHFGRVRKAVQYIESLRAQRMTEQFGPNAPPRQEPGKPAVAAMAFRGLVPESISHEGYSAKPMHSFWDNFFVLRGLLDAAYLANVVNEVELARQWQTLADEFRDSLIDSIRLAQQAHGIDYLPGCVELGDFDSTSSTILLWPVDQAAAFPRQWIEATFERYWREFQKRRDTSPPTWNAYTPYELRHVGAFVRLGQRDRAWAAMQWFLGHQRPAGWRHWAEVVWRDPATPRMIGDMPHTWCGSDFLNAARAMFVYEQHADQKLVVFAGIPQEWILDPAGVAFTGLRTEFGALSGELKCEGADRIIIRLDGSARPPGGFDIPWPLDRPIRSARVNGHDVGAVESDRLHIEVIPAIVELTY